MSMIVFTGGGTGGHIFPGLAVVDELKSRSGCEIAWIGSSRGIDREIVEGHGCGFYGIPSGKLRRYLDARNIVDAFRVIGGVFASIAILARLRPSLVFSKGGFVSVPPCLAARLLGIPVITHECDFSPGLATRIIARFAAGIFVSYEATRDLLPARYRKRVFVTGNPVRSAFYHADAATGREFLGCASNTVPIIFVQGGSLGARQVNSLIADCIDELCESFIVVHQTGAQNADQAIESSNPLVKERYKPFAFIKKEMPDVLAASSLVIARSGANTVWECAAVGKPMVLIPLVKGSSRGDQVENALFFVTSGAAIMLAGIEATPTRLAKAVREIFGSRSILADMTSNSAALGHVRPAALIADLLVERLSTVLGGNP